MIYKYIFGTPIPTDAVLEEVPNKRSLYGAHNFIVCIMGLKSSPLGETFR